MPRFPLLLAAVALGAALALPAGITAQAGPVEVFRAYWDSGLTPTDPGAEGFRSQAMLREIPEEKFPAEGLDAARARELGILRARVVSDGVVVVPSLAAVGL